MKEIYLGAAYYPEVWAEEEIEKDVARMKQTGINCVRIGEFAWSTMEPKEGEFDFSLFEKVVDILYANGISTVICTPTCTPPRWLFDKYPNTLQVNCDGGKDEVIARCHPCKSSTVMREKNRIIVEEMAKRFGKRNGVIGWQIDNEIFPYAGGCFCENCIANFKNYLKDKYQTVENLNNAWGMYRWSLNYNDFDEVVPPRPGEWEPYRRFHHPSLQIEWFRFQCQTIISYVNEQADVIRKYSDLPIGTDMMPMNNLGYYSMNQNLDVVQFNHYDTAENLPKITFYYDFLRTVKDKPFWVTETQAGWNGNVIAAFGYRPQGNCYVNTWLPIIKGAEMNLYWHFRAHACGHELGHGAMFSTAGREYQVCDEIRKVGAEFQTCKQALQNSAIRSKIAMHYSETAELNFTYAPLVEGFEYRRVVGEKIHGAFRHYNVDVIDTAHSLDGYETLISPFLSTVDENGLKARVIEWVEKGGRWIVGPMSDIMDSVACKYTEKPFSFLEDVTGAYAQYQMPLNTEMKAMYDGKEIALNTYFDAFVCKDCESIATYADKDFQGYTAIAKKKYGKGEIVLLGSVVSRDVLRALTAQQPLAEASENVILTKREGEVECLIAVEAENKEGYVVFEDAYTDLISGRILQGNVCVKPYEVLFGVKVDAK